MPDPSPATIRERVLSALVAQLAAALAPVPVERNRRSGTSKAEAPCLVVFDGGHSADSTEAFGETAFEMQASCDGTVTAADDSGLGTAINDLYGRIIAALGADRTLGGEATDVAETSLDVRVATDDESADPLAFFSLLLTLTYRTAFGDPYN